MAEPMTDNTFGVAVTLMQQQLFLQLLLQAVQVI
jgi:hypothetical protein